MAAARLTPIPCVELQSDTTMLAPQPLLYGCGVGTLGPLLHPRPVGRVESQGSGFRVGPLAGVGQHKVPWASREIR